MLRGPSCLTKVGGESQTPLSPKAVLEDGPVGYGGRKGRCEEVGVYPR